MSANAWPRCYVCDARVDPDSPLVLTEVVGFTKPRTQGGAHHIIGRRLTGRYVCGDHAGPIERGLAPTQEALL